MVEEKKMTVADFARCSASSPDGNNTRCEKMFDSNLTTSWISSATSSGEWVKFEFNGLREVHAIDLWQPRYAAYQCTELMLSFSNDVTVTVSCFVK